MYVTVFGKRGIRCHPCILLGNLCLNCRCITNSVEHEQSSVVRAEIIEEHHEVKSSVESSRRCASHLGDDITALKLQIRVLRMQEKAKAKDKSDDAFEKLVAFENAEETVEETLVDFGVGPSTLDERLCKDLLIKEAAAKEARELAAEIEAAKATEATRKAQKSKRKEASKAAQKAAYQRSPKCLLSLSRMCVCVCQSVCVLGPSARGFS